MMRSAVTALHDRVERPRIAIIAHSHPSATKGGAEIAAYSVYQGLLKLGHDVIFIAACPEKDQAKVSLASEREFLILHRPETYDHFYHVAAANLSRELNALLEREQVTVVNFHHFFNFGFGVLRDLKTSRPLRTTFTIHEYLAICQHHGQMVTNPDKLLCNSASSQACANCFPERTRQQFAIRKKLFTDVFDEVDAYVAPSQFLADRYIAWGLDESRMSVIENGLRVIPPPPASVNKTGQSRWIIGFFGQINPFKGVDLLMAVAAMIDADKSLAGRISIRLHGNLIGQSQEFIDQVTQLSKSGSSLIFLGPYDNSVVNRLMAECDYVIVPSRWWENSPVVNQEAFAAGRPVICTGIGGMAEKVTDGVSGFHFRHNDAQDLFAVIKRAADAAVWAKVAQGLPSPIDTEAMARQYLPVLLGPSEEMPASATSAQPSIDRTQPHSRSHDRLVTHVAT